MSDDPALPIAVQLIARFEGFSAKPYLDPKVWTIGYGSTYSPDGKRVTATTPDLTQAEALVWLQAVAARTLASVRAMVYVPISNNQAAALCSFAYNEGTAALRTSSTVMLPLNKGNYIEAANGLLAWVYAGGQFNIGLMTRRKKERDLFLTPDEEVA